MDSTGRRRRSLEADLDLARGTGRNLQLQRLAIDLLVAEKLVAVGFTLRQLGFLRLGQAIELEALLIQVVPIGDLPEQLGFTGVQAFGGKHERLFHRQEIGFGLEGIGGLGQARDQEQPQQKQSTHG